MRSCIYRGAVVHRRETPVRRRFRMPLYLLYLDLDELPRVFAGRWAWSVRRPAPARFRREDHLGDAATPLDCAVRDLVEAETGRRPGGPIRLLTQLRHFGYAMNPVSFYYCFAADGERLEALVAEVTNTPWGERYCYVLPARAGRTSCDKRLHVSPFLDMEQRYRFRFAEPGERLRLAIENRRPDGERVFSAALMLRRVEITGRSLAWVLIRYPFVTAQVLAGIYFQALQLRLRNVPFWPHPARGGGPLEVRP